MDKPRLRVLLVEAASDEAALIGRLLADEPGEEERYALRVAGSTAAACAELSRGRAEAVLLDVAVGREEGLEAFLRVRRQSPEAAIVALAGLRDEDLARRVVDMGAQDYLVKGVLEGRLLRRTIRYALALRRMQTQVDLILGKDADGKVVVDERGVVRYANAAAHELLARKPRDLVGRRFPHPLPDDGGTELRLPRAGGDDRVAELRCDAIDWGGATGRLVSLRDVTEARLVERLQSKVAEVSREARWLGETVSCISHELRSPLTTVKMAVSFLQDGSAGPLTPRQAQFLDMASRNIDRQTRIIDNNLDLARLQSGKVVFEARPVALSALLAELAQEFALTGRELLDVDFPPGLPAVRGDAELLTQVLRNLLDNAFRYAKSRVAVKACAQERQVELCVADDGVGIPKERLGELFARFAQVGRAEGRGGYKGTGLGLAICKEIVEGHQGRIWVESDLGRGARFHVRLPIFE